MTQLTNRRARFDYEVLSKYEAGISLTGAEVKSIKSGRTQLEASYVVIRQSETSGQPEAWLVNALIPSYENSREEGDPKRSRKLLLHRKELFTLEQKMKEGRLTIVPLAIYTTGRLVKLSIGLAKGRRAWEKRELLRRRDLKRESERELDERNA